MQGIINNKKCANYYLSLGRLIVDYPEDKHVAGNVHFREVEHVLVRKDDLGYGKSGDLSKVQTQAGHVAVHGGRDFFLGRFKIAAVPPRGRRGDAATRLARYQFLFVGDGEIFVYDWREGLHILRIKVHRHVIDNVVALQKPASFASIWDGYFHVVRPVHFDLPSFVYRSSGKRVPRKAERKAQWFVFFEVQVYA